MESFLDKLRDSLGAGVKLVEVGAKIPSIPFVEHEHHHEGAKEEDHDDHHHGAEDPHWWHSAENMKRAARIVADELSAIDPANAGAYAAGAKAASKRFGELKSWAQKEIAKVGKKDRLLVTAHGAFGYFCKEYGLSLIHI